MEKDSNLASPQDDGAGEKLVDEKNGHNSKGIEVKYITPSSQNGDAKIDIENLKSAFAGMGKEELMKFASDPFWVRTRWFLFILFWLLWAAMLAGAIAIIILAPKCAPPTPREWWEQSPLYKANVATFTKDSSKLQGDLKGFTTKLEYLSSLGVKTVVLSNILKVSDKESDGVDEFKTVAPSFGTLEDLKALISAAKDKGLKLLLTLIPNHSSLKSDLFNKSASKDPLYESFYIWAPGKGFTSEGMPAPPNNWLSKSGNSAWEWNEARKEFYLHQFDKEEPEFNFRNPKVVKFFDDVMQFWLDLGFSGFYLERTKYLIEDAELRNETAKRDIGSATHTEYEFYDHFYTENNAELAPLLHDWTERLANSSGILVVDDLSVTANRSLAHLIVRPQTLEPYPIFTAEDMVTLINKNLKVNPWPAWQIEVKNEEQGSPLAQCVLLSSVLLPGVPVTLAGQELGLSNLQEIPWDNTTYPESQESDVVSQQNNPHSLYTAYKELVEARNSPQILHGSLQLHIFNGTSVLAYTRIKSGNPGYLVVFNTGTEETTVDVRQMNGVPDELTLVVTSDIDSMADKSKLMSEAVTLPSRAVAVFRFVPKAKE
ncbi:neutral and basic amino acid transport protein rBAT-like [Homalodisca vitripennis]|uniref:neutral and basic amino acid transport protein rBAT-like n=1 Tax=Homalodisca vitripennis TaxID=197043 RepID=UPI001EEB98E5|nr:neutral and basic amino acid transport protein rBAT-like [Homalodisca vitripennis]